MKKKPILKSSPRKSKTTKDKTDWKRVHALTDRTLARSIASDEDTFVPDAAWFDKAKIALPKPKEMVTLRLDPDVMKWFRHDGRGYQTRINAVLRSFVEAQEHQAR